MAISLKPLHDQVIVITGASSGIGLATALAASQRGARIVLSSRNAEALAQVEDRIAGQGGVATCVVADVGRREDVQRIADTAMQRFGGFDTWVNNAGVGIWGRLDQVSDEDHRRLFETNFWGLVYGSLIAAEQLKRNGGALINLGSMASDRAFPLQGMYSASKHAVKGFTDALRMELEEEHAPVSVTLIEPAAVGTPMVEHVRNYTDKEPQFPPPIYDPEEVARAILHAAVRPKRDIFVGGLARMVSLLGQQAPRLLDRLSERYLFDAQLRDEPARARKDNLYRSSSDGRVRGRHPGHRMRRSVYTRAAMHPIISAAVVLAAGAAAGALLRRSRP